MSWRRVAALDLRRARRSRLLQAAVGGYVVGLLVFAVALAVVGEELTAAGALTHVIAVQEWLIPGIGLLLGYGAIVTERDARTLQHLVTVPFTRRDIVLGKFAARGAIVLGAVVVGGVVTAVSVAVLFPGFGDHLGGYALFVALTGTFGLGMVATGVGISAASDRPVRAATAAMAAFVGLVFLWDLLPAAAHYLRYGSFPGSGLPPDWYFFLGRVNPIEAYVEALTGAFAFLGTDLLHGTPAYLAPGAMVAILLAWIVLPLTAGYLLFRRTDIH